MMINTTSAGSAAQPANASQEGVLGMRPAGITSVAELMLHDTDTNVYENSSQVKYVQESGAVFNIRGRKQKVLSKREKEQNEAAKRRAIQMKAIERDRE